MSPRANDKLPQGAKKATSQASASKYALLKPKSMRTNTNFSSKVKCRLCMPTTSVPQKSKSKKGAKTSTADFKRTQVKRNRSTDKKVNRDSRVDKEVNRESSVDKKVNRDSSVDKEMNRDKLLNRDCCVDKEVRKDSRVDKEVNRDSSDDRKMIRDKLLKKDSCVDKELNTNTCDDKKMNRDTSVDKVKEVNIIGPVEKRKRLVQNGKEKSKTHVVPVMLTTAFRPGVAAKLFVAAHCNKRFVAMQTEPPKLIRQSADEKLGTKKSTSDLSITVTGTETSATVRDTQSKTRNESDELTSHDEKIELADNKSNRTECANKIDGVVRNASRREISKPSEYINSEKELLKLTNAKDNLLKNNKLAKSSVCAAANAENKMIKQSASLALSDESISKTSVMSQGEESDTSVDRCVQSKSPDVSAEVTGGSKKTSDFTSKTSDVSTDDSMYKDISDYDSDSSDNLVIVCPDDDPVKESCEKIQSEMTRSSETKSENLSQESKSANSAPTSNDDSRKSLAESKSPSSDLVLIDSARKPSVEATLANSVVTMKASISKTPVESKSASSTVKGLPKTSSAKSKSCSLSTVKELLKKTAKEAEDSEAPVDVAQSGVRNL